MYYLKLFYNSIKCQFLVFLSFLPKNDEKIIEFEIAQFYTNVVTEIINIITLLSVAQ